MSDLLILLGGAIFGLVVALAVSYLIKRKKHHETR